MSENNPFVQWVFRISALGNEPGPPHRTSLSSLVCQNRIQTGPGRYESFWRI